MDFKNDSIQKQWVHKNNIKLQEEKRNERI